MAAREHQGMQIALIIFVVLTISLGVTAFWFFDQFKNEQKKSQGEAVVAKKADGEKRQAQEELDKVKRWMNFGVKDEVGAMETEYKKDMEKFAKNFPEHQDYRFIVKELDTQLKKTNGQIVDDHLREAKLLTKVKDDQQVKAAEVATYEKSQEQIKADAAGERKTFNEVRNSYTQANIAIADKMANKNKEIEALAAKATSDQKEIMARLETMIERNEALVNKAQKEVISSENADGKVTWVNQRARLVWLNLGADDRLRRQISFLVIAPDENNPLKADKKGSVEVTRVLDRHLAEARIIDDGPSNPIMPGDSIFSAAWQPGRSERFALIGFMDIDKDGISDRQRIRDIITRSGGIVDAEVKDDGTRVGKLTVETRYLVRGESPTDLSTNSELRKQSSEFMDDCKTLPIKQISVPELIDYLGYKAQERTIPLGADSKGTDF